jgi:hypothetical protein
LVSSRHVSALTRNRTENFSVGRLIEFLAALGEMKPTRKAQGEVMR